MWMKRNVRGPFWAALAVFMGSAEACSGENKALNAVDTGATPERTMLVTTMMDTGNSAIVDRGTSDGVEAYADLGGMMLLFVRYDNDEPSGCNVVTSGNIVDASVRAGTTTVFDLPQEHGWICVWAGANDGRDDPDADFIKCHGSAGPFSLGDTGPTYPHSLTVVASCRRFPAGRDG